MRFRQRRAAEPGWTDHNDSDPGTTLLTVLAYSAAALGGVLAASRWRARRAHRPDGT